MSSTTGLPDQNNNSQNGSEKKPLPVALQQPPAGSNSPLGIAANFLTSLMPSSSDKASSSGPFDLNGFDLNKASQTASEKGLFPAVERVLSHAAIGFLVGSLAAWAQATKPVPPARSSGIISSAAAPAMSGPVRYEAIANHVAKSGAQVAILGGIFSGTLEVSEYYRQCKDTYTYAAAGFITGLTSAVFNRSVFKVVLQRSVVLGLASGAYYRLSEGSEEFGSITRSGKKTEN